MDPEPAYTLYIRLPFARGDFVDPPAVNWDSSKDERLWNILSGVSKTEIDWDAIAADFDVTVDFLLRQVTYLTERHASQVRAQMQMRKATAGKRGSAAPSPVPGSESTTAAAAEMRRVGSAGGYPRAPSSLSIRKDAGVSGGKQAVPLASGSRPQASRASSSGNTPQQKRGAAAGTPTLRQQGPDAGSQRKRLSSLPIVTTPTSATRPPRHEEDDDGDDEYPQGGDESPGPAESSSASSSRSSSPAQSRIIRRPPRATLRGDPRDMVAARRSGGVPHPQTTPKGRRIASLGQSQTSDSSAGSAALVNRSPAQDGRNVGPLSPKRTAELSGRAGSRAKGKGHGMSNHGSDGGTPSMGSSFSDLDDASVTQSALEEALASNMQADNTIGSRMSVALGRALGSRYLPRSNRP
ncbi:hypothetical protein MAPG_02217 [Magnaporthiopsis poae ATCC 64411]|uniref:Autophagy-related protein 29 n=1 Tax=Magnaporthiopsis poae (strain ATCC 64411 / 73-15) TaxID=644358 RepID=A0A0C4DQS1_MAGP6|nr:hypothetical protein MAPG_02217 [Magnaporthiopsis poae ATCC 64411]